MDAKSIDNKIQFLNLFSVCDANGLYDFRYVKPYCKYLLPFVEQDEKIIIPVYCRAKISLNKKFNGTYPTLILFTNKRIIVGYKALLGLFKGLEILNYSDFSTIIEIESKENVDVLTWKGNNGIDLEFAIAKKSYILELPEEISAKRAEVIKVALQRILFKYEIDKSVVGKGDAAYDNAVENYEKLENVTNKYNEIVKSKIYLDYHENELSEDDKNLLRSAKYSEFLSKKGLKDTLDYYEI